MTVAYVITHGARIRKSGVRFSREALPVFFREYEKALHRLDVRRRIRQQAEELRRVLLGQSPVFTPFRWSARS